MTATPAASPLDDLRLLPQPRICRRLPGAYRLRRPAVEIGAAAAALLRILPAEWRQEFGRPVAVKAGAGAGFYFRIGRREAPKPAGRQAEGYALQIGADGIGAGANTAAGLLYAWQTLKQILRASPGRAPGLRIGDWPALRWRVYHLDLKGTRRTLANLHAILPRLAEFKVNAVLAEYEDYVRLDRHPALAVPGALTKSQVKDWIAAARDYNLTVIPLVQTLGHLQYVLRQPAYSHLQEKPGNPAEACCTHPDTWPLIRDFLDEIMELHAGLPLFHVGLDETFNLGTCPRCQAALGGRSKMTLYVDWVNRCCRHVRAQGFTPLVWGDVAIAHFDDPQVKKLDPGAYYIDWGYKQTGPRFPSLLAMNSNAVSREWLQRPNGEIYELPRIGFGPGRKFYEDFPGKLRASWLPWLANPEYPRKFKTDVSTALLTKRGFKTGAVSGIRVSFHGCVAPQFITGQLNTLTAAEACKKYRAEILIGSSWARGHSLAGMNAHPELDWYGIATLGAAGWGKLARGALRDFDRRFGFQFFGLPDGRIGDLYFLFERSSARVDHVMDNYLPYVLEASARLAPLARRNAEKLALFQAAVKVQQARYRAQFAALELEYFYALWERVPPDFKARIRRDIAATAAAIGSLKAEVGARYAQTIVPGDAAELAATQLDFFRDQMLLLAGRQFPGVRFV